MNYMKSGTYRHYKGAKYKVLGLGIEEASVDKSSDELKGNLHVVYAPLSSGSMLEGTDVNFWLRPLDDFNEWVNVDGLMQPRFLRDWED